MVRSPSPVTWAGIRSAAATTRARPTPPQAQLLLRVASFSPTIKEVPVTTRYDIRSRPSRLRLRDALVEHWRLGSAAAPAEAR